MEDTDKLPGAWKAEDAPDPPEPEIVFSFAGCRMRIGKVRTCEGKDCFLSYILFFDGEKVMDGYASIEDAKQGAIEFLEEKLSATEERIEEMARMAVEILDDSPRSQAQKNEPADRMEADQKSRMLSRILEGGEEL